MAELYKFLPELQGRELALVQELTQNYNEEQMLNFANVYRTRRKDPQLILLTCLLGLIVIAGVHRFIIGQIGMGLLYLFTGGLCLIGTIIDAVNYQNLAFEYNQKIAQETALMIGNK